MILVSLELFVSPVLDEIVTPDGPNATLVSFSLRGYGKKE